MIFPFEHHKEFLFKIKPLSVGEDKFADEFLVPFVQRSDRGMIYIDLVAVFIEFCINRIIVHKSENCLVSAFSWAVEDFVGDGVPDVPNPVICVITFVGNAVPGY